MPARESRTPLSRDRILAAAIAIADAEGAGAITMRRVADALGCEAMTLYHYVPDKTGLLAGMVEAIVDEIIGAGADSAPMEGGDWRDTVRRRCLAARQVMLAHPWAPSIVAAQVQTPPNMFVIFEALVGAMAEAGASYDLAHRAIHALGSMLLGFTQELFQPTIEDTGTPTGELEAMARAFPHLTGLAASAMHEAHGSLSLCDTQAEFEFTLGLILDGLEAHRVAGI